MKERKTLSYTKYIRKILNIIYKLSNKYIKHQNKNKNRFSIFFKDKLFCDVDFNNLI